MAQGRRFLEEQAIEARGVNLVALVSGFVALTVRIRSFGSPRSASSRLKASKGEEVNTPPKSQITASMATTPLLHLFSAARTLESRNRTCK